ncbi:MAG: YncE family protein [Streptosporangiaceae bacterium]
MFKGATCNATHRSGCSQTPAVLQLGQSAGGASDLYIALNQQTHTLHATNVDYATQTADSVYVINAAICDADDTIGCNQIPATVTVGDDPRGLTVDPATDTIYVVNHAAGDYAASVSVINGTTCNATDTKGCNRTPAEDAVGNYPYWIALDPAAGTAYVSSINNVSVIPLTCGTR